MHRPRRRHGPRVRLVVPEGSLGDFDRRRCRSTDVVPGRCGLAICLADSLADCVVRDAFPSRLRGTRGPRSVRTLRRGGPPGHHIRPRGRLGPCARRGRRPPPGFWRSRGPRRARLEVRRALRTREGLSGAYEQLERLAIPSSIVVIRVDGADPYAERGDQLLDARGFVESEDLEVVDAAAKVVFVGGALRGTWEGEDGGSDRRAETGARQAYGDPLRTAPPIQTRRTRSTRCSRTHRISGRAVGKQRHAPQ